MTDLCAIVPVKPLDTAKSRLASVLAPTQRRRLVLTMLQDVLGALARVPAVGQTFVVTADAEVAHVAVSSGVRTITESEALGLNAGVEAGLAVAARMGFARALVLPADLPLLSAEDVARLTAETDASGRPQVALAPAADGDGTNALLVSPPDALVPRFGPGSFLAHLGQALARRLDLRVQHLTSLAVDIDTPADLVHLEKLARYSFLRQPGGEDRPHQTG